MTMSAHLEKLEHGGYVVHNMPLCIVGASMVVI